jgi:rare lipoprotein A
VRRGARPVAATARAARMRIVRRGAGAVALFTIVLVAGCAGVPRGAPGSRPPATDASAPGGPVSQAPRPDGRASTRAPRCGACYLDDGPGDDPPPDLASIPDAVPRPEPAHPAANRPYTVFGRAYVPRPDVREHRERGHASWYGRKFHGRPTSSGERYDMYAMTAAHPTLPIPSYVRVTHLRNGRSVVVRVNDRGPFLNRRVIDLSYTAAHRLGYVEAGSAEVEIELLSAPGMPGPPVQTALRADPAGARPAAPAGGAAPWPMLAEAAAERLSIETTVDDRPAAPLVAAAAPAAAPDGAGGVWLQFGAYASRDNAELARARLQRDVPWLLAPAELVRSGETWRVQVGPWDRREDAVAVADRIAAAGAPRPVPVAR